MDSEWTTIEDMDFNTHEDGLNPWKTPRIYHRRKGQDRRTPSSAILCKRSYERWYINNMKRGNKKGERNIVICLSQWWVIRRHVKIHHEPFKQIKLRAQGWHDAMP